MPSRLNIFHYVAVSVAEGLPVMPSHLCGAIGLGIQDLKGLGFRDENGGIVTIGLD